jgi:hypothetical protein
MQNNHFFSNAILPVVKPKSSPNAAYIEIYKKTGNKIELKVCRELRWL